MTRDCEVRTRHGWRRLGRDAEPPRIVENDLIELRGAPRGQRIRIGRTDVVANKCGTVELRPVGDDHLRGHIGLVPVLISGKLAGEIEIVPGKLSQAAYDELRADLHRVWGDLVLDPGSVAAVRSRPPAARELWRRIDHVIAQILANPNEHLRVGVGIRRMERVRHRRELQPAVVRAGHRGRAAFTRVLERTTETPENQLVAATLGLLKNHARREPGGDELVRRIEQRLREPLLSDITSRPLQQVTWGMQGDPRYRQVLAVHQILDRPELAAIEGPGELRLGVAALPRLYEYWVFLQVLVAASKRYGHPREPGFAGLARPLRGRRARLTLPRGMTVTFPGPVHVAFEPDITTRGDGWMGLEYVPHPDREDPQLAATPDVVVFRTDDNPWLTVVDAKYVGREWVEAEAARVHEKYARMRWHGTPVVRNVLVAHPHEAFSAQWAGYGHLPLRPGHPVPHLPLPLPSPTVEPLP